MAIGMMRAATVPPLARHVDVGGTVPYLWCEEVILMSFSVFHENVLILALLKKGVTRRGYELTSEEHRSHEH